GEGGGGRFWVSVSGTGGGGAAALEAAPHELVDEEVGQEAVVEQLAAPADVAGSDDPRGRDEDQRVDEMGEVGGEIGGDAAAERVAYQAEGAVAGPW
ncbi:hypothetical protein LTR66_017011, partial [Elasticomyces elasticus]